MEAFVFERGISCPESCFEGLHRAGCSVTVIDDPSDARASGADRAHVAIWVVDDASKIEPRGASKLWDIASGMPLILVASDEVLSSIALDDLDIFRDVMTYPPDPERLLGSVLRLREIRHLRGEAKRLQESVAEVEEELELYREFKDLLGASLEKEDVFDILLAKCSEMIPADSWALLLVNETTGGLSYEAVRGSAQAHLQGYTLEPERGIPGWVAKTGRPAVVNDVSVDDRHYPLDEISGLNARTTLCVPIQSKGRMLGVLEIVNKARGGTFDRGDLERVLALADYSSVAIESALLFEKTQQLALLDDLTQVSNYRYLDECLEREFHRARHYPSAFSLLFLDLDGFKKVNDDYGHPTGSIVLREVAQLIRRQLRRPDLIARFGGDEFTIFLPETGCDGAIKLAQRILDVLATHTFHGDQDLQIKLGVSIGVASYPDHCGDKHEMIRMADRAMYAAKASPDTSIAVADPDDDSPVNSHGNSRGGRR